MCDQPSKRGDDEFSSPIAKGMSRTNSTQRSRKRVLADDELRDLWAALDTIEEPICYPFYVRTLLLTAPRRTESARMLISPISGLPVCAFRLDRRRPLG
jgi:hypothetical protein